MQSFESVRLITAPNTNTKALADMIGIISLYKTWDEGESGASKSDYWNYASVRLANKYAYTSPEVDWLAAEAEELLSGIDVIDEEMKQQELLS
jgi:hypothetical protein